MKYYESMQELIGNTPMVKLGHINENKNVMLFGKLELYNPAGSVKDRVGKYMIEDAIQSGKLKEGYTIVEATAGNTGLGVAFAALNRGFQVIFVVPTKFSEEKQKLMKALGATVVNTPREKGMLGAIQKAEELKQEIGTAVSLEQFKNMANPQSHYESTGPEIYDALEGQIDYVVLGAGSGGTYTGVMKYLKEKNPNIKGVLADPVGSTLGGGEHKDYNIEGIGNNFVPETMDMSLVDEVIKVDDQESFEAARQLAVKEGIFAGTSSGAAMAAAEKLIQRLESGNVVVVLPDRGERYFSTGLYD